MTHKTNGRPRFQLLCALSLLLALTALASPARGQTIPEPTREKLLNGLTVLLWQRPGDSDLLLKLRINSGAAFDPAGKGGAMALLGDVLFPDPTTREFITDQLGGRLEIVTDHDTIDVTIAGKASDLERMIDLLRGAIVSIQLTPENVARVRDNRLKTLSEKAALASDIADHEIVARLLGKFPYGHPASGTVETVTKVDRADLMLARERFLNADNATIVVIGGVEKARAMRALRQLLGPWNKGDRTVPSTFRQPDAPDPRVLVINRPEAAATEIRLAVRGLALSDPDAAAATLLARIVRERWQSGSPDLATVFARHEAHMLPGVFVLGASRNGQSTGKAVASAREVMRSLASSEPPTVAELDRARDAELSEIAHQTARDLADATALSWLRMETFKLLPPATSMRTLTAADLQRVAVRLFKDTPVATVVVGNSEQLKAAFDGAVEVRGESPGTAATPVKKP